MLRLRHRARHSGTAEILPEAFAMVKASIGRILGIQATEEQLLAGLHMLQGSIVEMNAGEGKTIAAAFPAVVHALRGRSVHIITANDYLAARDAELLAPVYRSLGISAGAVLGYMDDGERKLAYRKGIVYSTMRELGFDFLRDNLKFSAEAQVQGKLEVAIIDEIDHALIDEAATPMIISGNPIGNNRATTRVKNVVAEMIGLQREEA
ncbi:MAG: preprotein translocase subunit SecA, partial [Dehalococcoidia bacterium]|nr:preprotein translocase subunit SecA [Dehalococcoidia bacterium]